MTQTNFDKAPYFDDFDEEKNFHRVLFKPGIAVQTRELTQLQTILQEQIKRFGDNILVEGTIIKGCNFTEIRNLGYVKILDDQLNGAPVSMASYKSHRATGATTGVEGIVTEVTTGFESQSPNLNTLFVTYTNSGNNGEKVFSATETIEITDIVSGNSIGNVVAAGTVETPSIGKAYAVKVSDGIIYQKGFFIGVDEQLKIITKYTDVPNGLVVGFSTNESIVDSNEDTSLLDNATGSPNENAPGADRFKLTPVLTVKTKSEANADENFLAIQEYESGRVVRKRGTTQYSAIFDEVRKRTFEESGNYTVNDFDIQISSNSSNSDILDVGIGRGRAYVEGRRVDLLNKINIPLNKSTEFDTEIQQNISTNYGNYIVVDEYVGNFDFDQNAQVSLHDTAQDRFTAGSVGSKDSASEIGTARVRSVIHHNGTKGTANTQYRMYLFDIQMESGESFDDVRTIFYDGTNKGSADVVLQNGEAVLEETSFRLPIFNIGREAIKEIPTSNTDYTYRKVDASLTADQATAEITINLAGADEWPYGTGALNNTQKLDIDLICNETQAPYTNGQPIDLSGSTVVVNDSQSMTITLASAPAADMSVIAYYDVKRTSAASAGKLAKSIYVKIDANTHPNGTDGPYSLGVPDAFEIEGIWQGSTYSESETDVTSKFVLVENQNDTYYGLSYLRKKAGHTVGANDLLLIKARVFQKSITGSFDEGFFSIDSYPIDDANTANTSAITTQEIPVYRTESGRDMDLRNVIDFRPHAANTADFAVTEGAATENPSSTLGFPTTSSFFPSPNKNIEADYSYYLGRKDLIFINTKGEFQIIEGNSSETPAPPSEPDSGLVLATVNVPPFPSLPIREANLAGKPNYGVNIRRRDNRRYTMRDIGGIDRRVTSLEYYVSLNALEQDTINLLITDDTGANRFKNGIFVDNFRDLNIADVRNTEFSAAIDPTYNEITPKLKIVPLDLEAYNVGSWSNAKNYVNSETATLTPSNTNVVVTEQPYATTFRNCVTDFYNFSGQVTLTPEFDSGYDTTIAPATTIDLTESFSDFTESLSEFIPMSSTTRSSRLVETVWGNAGRNTTTIETVTENQSLGVTGVTEQSVGDFVSDIRFNPFMQSRNINVNVNGLRPNTRHYFFFDDVPVSDNVAPAVLNTNVRSGGFGEPVISDANGRLTAIFRLPADTFYVGDRKLKVLDVDLLSAESSATSKGNATYHAFNIDVERTEVSTRIPEFGINTDIEVETQTIVTQRGQGGGDPISQTFTVPSDIVDDDKIILDGVDLYFRTKSETQGVTMQIRNVVNGYPGYEIVPLSSVHLNPDEVNVSTSSSAVTTFTFKGPVSLKTGQDYCIVILPDGNSPDYNLFIGKTGQVDLISDAVITQDTNGGTLFTSTNNKAWTPYQDENMKFRIRRNTYSVANGTIDVTNRDHEFLTIESETGIFTKGETVGVLNANATGTAALVEGNNTIIGTGTSFENLEVGENVAFYETNTDIHVTSIQSITSNTEMTVTEVPFSSNASANFFPTITGEITFYTRNEPAKMVLMDSSARSGAIFEANNTIFGETSGATATITSVDDQFISYIQPNIRRSNSSKTRLTTSANVYSEDSSSIYNKQLSLVDNNYFKNQKTIVKSRSNEISESTGKTFVLTADMSNKDECSPIIDYGISNVMAYEYVINGNSANETTTEGAADTKYVSKIVELADGLDADDIKVYLTAYRPPSTDVKVYVRFQNESDPENFNEVPWTELDVKNENNSFSSNANRFDYRELEFNVPRQESGDFSNGSGAALNIDNNNILRYQSSEGVVYDRYKFYAIKVVLLSSQEERVPRIKDIRAVALS